MPLFFLGPQFTHLWNEEIIRLNIPLDHLQGKCISQAADGVKNLTWTWKSWQNVPTYVLEGLGGNRGRCPGPWSCQLPKPGWGRHLRHHRHTRAHTTCTLHTRTQAHACVHVPWRTLCPVLYPSVWILLGAGLLPPLTPSPQRKKISEKPD